MTDFLSLVCPECNHGLRFLEADTEWVTRARRYLACTNS